MTLTDQNYKTIAQRVYEVDPVQNPDGQRELGSTCELDNQTYQVIDVLGNGEQVYVAFYKE